MNQFLGVDDEESYYVPNPNWHHHWHIDGFPDAIKQLQTGFCPGVNMLIKVGEVKNFTMLIGIYLSSTEQDNMGNFTVYPGSHLLLEKFFKEKGGVIKFLDGTFEGAPL